MPDAECSMSMPNVKNLMPDAESSMIDAECLMQDCKFSMLDAECSIPLDARLQMLDA
jgi:hypothetical protein